MASWSEFFGTNNFNRAPEWMIVGPGSVASQVIRYPAPQYSDYPGYAHPPPPVDRRGYHNAPAVGPPVMTMELKVPICCEGCEERVLSRLIDIDGVQSVKCDQLRQKVTVSGTAPPAEVINACKKIFKRSKWWSS